MCSIFAILSVENRNETTDTLRQYAIEHSRKMRHRGPDWSGVYQTKKAILVHERLAIVDINNGAQPLKSPKNKEILAVNGEIYNHKELRNQFPAYDFQTNSDCEVILPLYQKYGVHFLNRLSGIFAFVLYDEQNDTYLIARDPIGVIPLYIGRDEHGCLYVSSELKGIESICNTVEDFPPGHYLSSDTSEPVRYYNPQWKSYDKVATQPFSQQQLKQELENAVQRQLMCDVPYGVLLSGGLDSSLIASITQKFAAKRIESQNTKKAWWPRLHTFSIGLHGSPDLVFAKKVAEFIDSVHHEFHFTVQEGIDALSEVIYHIETYDVTSIRASTPMYLMARKIKAMGIKMVLSGEGADEIFGGYLYFHKAPNAQEFHEENVRKLQTLYKYDCLRANKSMAAWGVEARVPFLDREFLDYAMAFNPNEKMIHHGKMEKHALRASFEGYLPPEILWRQKEQFSDGVGYSWIDGLKDFAEQKITDAMLEKAKYRFPINTPITKEGYLYRQMFTRHFPSAQAANCVPGGPSIACSTPTAILWDESFKNRADPSGRAVLGVHQQAYSKGIKL